MEQCTEFARCATVPILSIPVYNHPGCNFQMKLQPINCSAKSKRLPLRKIGMRKQLRAFRQVECVTMPMKQGLHLIKSCKYCIISGGLSKVSIEPSDLR